MSTLLVVYSALLSPSVMVLLKSSVFSFSFAFINEFMPVFAFGFVYLLIEFHSRICIYLFVLARIFCNFFRATCHLLAVTLSHVNINIFFLKICPTKQFRIPYNLRFIFTPFGLFLSSFWINILVK